ncbi:MAG: hypothetical protein ACRDRV_16705 [Pseudonocardiaceae bacterium]
MDEERLGELFREAVGEPPPPSFGRAEVVAASRRATARRRGALAGGTLLGVAVLTAGMLSSGVLGGGNPETSATGRAAPHADARSAPPELPHTLGTAPSSGPSTASGGAGQAGCARRDDALVTEVTAVLAGHGIAVAGPVGEVPGPCPAGSRGAAVPVPGGMLYVLVVPQADPPARSDVVQPDGRREHALMLDGGRGLVLISTPAVAGRPAPLNEDVPQLAAELAHRL